MARKFNVEQAKRVKIYPKIGIFSPSGGGKSYSSLRLATGMIEQLEKITGEKKQIWLANNEGSRGKYYANEFDYKIIELEAPHDPEMYYDLIEYAENSPECGVLIIDSLSKEWAGPGGCLEIANKLGGQFQEAWKRVSPRHRRLMDKMVDSHLTIIATMRGEDQYTVETDPHTGKSKPVKIGIGAKQGKDFEYEFSLTFSLDQKTNCAETFKDNTHLFENKPAMKLTEQDGINLIIWANESDVEPEKKVENKTTEQQSLKDNLKNIISQIDVIAKEKAAINKDVTFAKIKEFAVNGKGEPTANYNAIKDVNVAQKLLDALKELNVESEVNV
jgi:hypothetical protein